MAKKNLKYSAEKIDELLTKADEQMATKTDLKEKVDKVSGKGLSTNDYTTAEKNKLSNIQDGAQKNTVTSVRGSAEVSGQVGAVVISPASIGLGNIENRVIALEGSTLNKSSVGVAGGVASLGTDGRVPSSQLPSYVDDVIEVANYESLPTSGESGKIYITQSDNKTYRWSGSGYAEVSASLALGETEQTAYSGAKGKKNAEDIAKLAKDLDETHQLASNAESAISEVVELTIPAIENELENKLGKTEKAADSAKADSATKLATPRTLWGQSFDGSGDVSEEITISGDGRKVVNVKSKAASDYAGLIAYMSTSSPTSETGGVVFNGSSATYKYGVNALNVFNTRGDIHYEAATNYHHIFHNELKFTVVADQDLCAGVRTAFKTSIAQIGTLIGNHFYLGKEASDKYIRFRKYTGISNASPSSITDLMTIDTSGNVVITGTMTATTTYHSSDERLKDFEGDVEVDLEKLKTLPKKYFKWKEHPERGRTLGTSAQALQKIYPELVATRTDGMLSVNYEGLAVVALAAVDKLAEQNKAFEERLLKIEKLLNIE